MFITEHIFIAKLLIKLSVIPAVAKRNAGISYFQSMRFRYLHELKMQNRNDNFFIIILLVNITEYSTIYLNTFLGIITDYISLF